MDDLVWILASEKSNSFGNSGISASYILPKNEIAIDPRILAGKRLWFVLRESEDRLFQVIRIKKVERIIDGYYAGDYLISSVMIESIKLVHSYQKASKFRTTSLQNLKLGISSISNLISSEFLSLVFRSVQTTLLTPGKQLFSNIDFQLITHNAKMLARNALIAVLTQFSLEEVWARGMAPKLAPFANFAYELLSNTNDAYPSPIVIEFLKNLDPIQTLSFNGAVIESSNGSRRAPKVDIEFSEIDPKKIFAREFVSAGAKNWDIESALNKTEHAEKIHQAMLKDIAEYLISRGVMPFESGSIDLMYRTGAKLSIIEIKSANEENILSQSSKGAFQIACYTKELQKDFENLEAILVIHEIDNSEVQDYAIGALRQLGISALIYSPAIQWPERIKGLEL